MSTKAGCVTWRLWRGSEVGGAIERILVADPVHADGFGAELLAELGGGGFDLGRPSPGPSPVTSSSGWARATCPPLCSKATV